MIPPEHNHNWSQEITSLYTHDMEQYWDKTLSIHQWNQYKNLLDTYLEIANVPNILNILDVGCAQATLALLLAEKGHNVCAVDIRQEFLDYAKSRHEFGNIEFIQGNVLDLNFDKKFDLIYANQIIEHLVYPQDMINNLKKLLRDSGTLVVTTPNWRYFKNTLPSFSEIGDPEELTHKQFTADGDGHFFAYKQSELIDIFKDVGFNTIQSVMFESPIISGHIKFRYIHKYIPHHILKLLDKAMLSIPKVSNLLSHQLMLIATK